MAKQSHTPSRRAMLAGLAAAPAVGLPALAGVGGPLAMADAPTLLSDALAQAIELHKVAMAGLAAAPDDDDAIDRLSDVEFDARLVIAELPVATEGELLQKLRHLYDHEREAWGGNWDASDKFGSVFAALDVHFNGESQQ
ncbi:hypothetical protein IYY11_17035 [Methylocystis sp. H62]|uniref:hypothetical protein n=1 Tax=Methylocystis sp. H62 TaxID=2785789 RepID=UPI0018C2FB43|nr:hypothetical protein [Methylocystis sp. H62]MBG0795060.1 hypothetical protein [Methylocystis sp. H62]